MNDSNFKIENAGLLVNYRDLTKEDLDVFIQQFSSDKGIIYRFIADLLESPYNFLQFIDVLSSKSIKVPSINQSLKILEEIRIWKYLRNKEITYNVLKACSNAFKDSESIIKATPKRCYDIFIKMESLYGDKSLVEKYQEYPKSKGVKEVSDEDDTEESENL